MHFSTIPALIDAHLNSLISKKPLKDATLFLTVTSKDPLVLEDSGKMQALPQHDDLEIYLQTYDKIEVGSPIRMDNIVIDLQFTQCHSINKVRFSSKSMVFEVGLEKQRELKNFELRLSVAKGDTQLPLSTNSLNALRRLQLRELVRKYYKPTNTDILAFTGKKTIRQHESSTTAALDSRSIAYLRKILPFVNKQQLFKLLLRKPLKERESKRALRLSIFPNHVQNSLQLQIKKKEFNRMTVLQLLAEYRARDAHDD